MDDDDGQLHARLPARSGRPPRRRDPARVRGGQLRPEQRNGAKPGQPARGVRRRWHRQLRRGVLLRQPWSVDVRSRYRAEARRAGRQHSHDRPLRQLRAGHWHVCRSAACCRRPGPAAQRVPALVRRSARGGAHDLGAAGLDDDSGYGRLDALAAYQRLAGSPDFTVSASPSSVTVAPGGGAAYTASIVSTNGFGGDVTLGLAGLSAQQATWTFNPPFVAKGSGSAQLSISTATTIAPGTYPLTITATSGAITRTATATLAVSGPPDFTIAAAPTSKSVAAGASASYSVGVTALNGFTGDVSQSAGGPPAWAEA